VIERVTDYPGYLVRFTSTDAKPGAVLFLHGFPANRNVKNLDLADVVHRASGRDCFVLHYRGLGESPGDFRFTESIKEAVTVAQRLAKSHGSVTIVGHSWGGLVAMNVTEQCATLVDRLILLSPLCELDRANSLYDWILNGVKTDCPGVYGKLSQQEIQSELDGVLERYEPKNIVGKIPATLPITLIQAALDVTTPATAAKALLPYFLGEVKYVELAQDHSFSQSRRELADTILQAMGVTLPAHTL